MKTFKLNPKPKDKDGNEVDVDSEDRTIVITEEIEQSLLDQLPESARNKLASGPERVTVANLKNDYEEQVEAVKNAIKKANEIAQKINDIDTNIPELPVTGKPSEIVETDRINQLDSKRPTLRKASNKSE